MHEDSIKFTADDGSEIILFVEEQARVNGTDYLLVTDSSEDDANAFIFKDISEESSEEGCYVPVEDETELEALSKVFAELLEDTDLRM